jgi:hypothetical protein
MLLSTLAVLLWISVVIAAASIGLILVPPALLATVATAMASVVQGPSET